MVKKVVKRNQFEQLNRTHKAERGNIMHNRTVPHPTIHLVLRDAKLLIHVSSGVWRLPYPA
jgi:hypothetical protein